MLFSTLLSVVPLFLSASILPTAAASTSNFTLNRPEARTTTTSKANWQTAKCATVQGDYYGYKYNFGCLCDDDIEDFCSNNKINSYIKSLLYYYIQQNGQSYTFPPNAQPLCNGDYSCGSLSKLSDGTCGKTTCDPTQCSTNGGCCPRGQTYSNGKCCGRVGCSQSASTCTPILQCPTYESNNVCCPSGTSGWTGYDTVCCPTGQTEKSGQCVCAAGYTKNGNSCTAVCGTGQKWCDSRCCPTGSSQSGSDCVCDSNQQQLNSDKSACVNKCPSGQTFYTKSCCPAGALEDKNGNCYCTSSQQKLTGSGSTAACVDKCSTGFTFYTKTCCPAGAQEDSNGNCYCTSSQQKLTGSGTTAACVNKCATGFTFYTKTCCPAGAQEDSNGHCYCTSSQQKLSGSGSSASCINKCATGFTFYTKTCCPSGAQEDSNGNCYCTSSAQQLQGTGTSASCVSKCDSSSKWCNSKCCKSYMDEDSTGKCVCPTAGYIDNGSKCVNQCQSTQKYNTATGKCDDICDTSAGYTYQIGTKGDGMCCKKGQTACTTMCCPAGQEEIGTSKVCCTTGSTVVNGACVSPTGVKTNSRRALAGRLQAIQLVAPATAATYGLEANSEGKLCPAGLAACPIPGRLDDQAYECLDSSSDLTSCGGCTSLGSGVDCTTIPGAKWMGCNVGKCEVYSCVRGYKKSNDGSSCVKL